jgi:hypothetical protein
MSSQEGLFDVVYLGVFIILSPAFDGRFYQSLKPPPPALVEEVAFAIRHFHSILLTFSRRFIIILEGELVSHTYVVHRMLGEFAAAAVFFSKSIEESHDEDEDDGNENDDSGMTPFRFERKIEKILHCSYPQVFPYYSSCLKRCHKYFIWTGPDFIIVPRNEGFNSLISLTTMGALLDLPFHEIYSIPPEPTSPTPLPVKRHIRGDSFDLEDDQVKKRKR